MVHFVKMLSKDVLKLLVAKHDKKLRNIKWKDT